MSFSFDDGIWMVPRLHWIKRQKFRLDLKARGGIPTSQINIAQEIAKLVDEGQFNNITLVFDATGVLPRQIKIMILLLNALETNKLVSQVEVTGSMLPEFLPFWNAYSQTLPLEMNKKIELN